MNIIFFTKGGACARSVHLSHWVHYLFPVVLFAVLGAGLTYGGYFWGLRTAPEERLVRWEEELREQRRQIETAQQLTQANIDVLTQRLGRLQGHVTRLDALGNKLVKMAEIDASEFNFSNPPALGGPEGGSVAPDIVAPSLEAAIDALAEQLVERERQLMVIDDALMTRNLAAEVLPAGRPINKGWISSYYGMRSDPFTGRPEFHKGMDFAGKAGSDVVAVGGGVVTWAGKRYGYGNLVEINHGNGYVTRYGHNKEIVVSEGDTVKKGQAVAKMGSTGRSTGPHVHFEVIHRGKHVNPQKYIQSSR
jgi:murein DD-endopeptidase MepM/ murein hydrolase activator NlpD